MLQKFWLKTSMSFWNWSDVLTTNKRPCVPGTRIQMNVCSPFYGKAHKKLPLIVCVGHAQLIISLCTDKLENSPRGSKCQIISCTKTRVVKTPRDQVHTTGGSNDHWELLLISGVFSFSQLSTTFVTDIQWFLDKCHHFLAPQII